MIYTIKFIDGSKIQITEDEYKKLANKTGLVFIPSLRETINLSSISRIYPTNTEDQKKIDREKQMIGVTPSGETVEKRYGVWYYQKSNNDFQYDNEGRCTLRYEGHSILPTVTEYEAFYQNIPLEEWLPKLIEQSENGHIINNERRLSNGLESIGINEKNNTLAPSNDDATGTQKMGTSLERNSV